VARRPQAFAAGQIEASVRSRTFSLQIAAMRRDNELFARRRRFRGYWVVRALI
jgi:hypothetical protein